MKFLKKFKSKKIVHSKTYQPGELIKVFSHNGKKYARIAFTNRQKYQGMMPITDVLFSDVTGIRKIPSPIKKKALRLVGIKAKSKLIVFTK